MRTTQFFLTLMLGCSTYAFSWIKPVKTTTIMKENAIQCQAALIASCMFFPMVSFAASDIGASPSITISKSYSQNARNFDRINEGDFSGGSVYDNNPSAPGARRRRAMQGCKIQSAREEASDRLNLNSFLSEKECNVKVMEDSPDFMLEAMQSLMCPKCPYGIKSTR